MDIEKPHGHRPASWRGSYYRGVGRKICEIDTYKVINASGLCVNNSGQSVSKKAPHEDTIPLLVGHLQGQER